MQIPKALIDRYLKAITAGRAVNMPDPLSDLSHFDADIRTMRSRALRAGHLDWLRLSIDALLARPEGRISAFAGLRYPFNDEDLVAVLSRAYDMIWPDQPRSEPGDELDLEFADIDAEAWLQHYAR